MFQRCCDRLCLVFVLQVFVCDLKDGFSFFPFLFILPHFTWRQQQEHVNVNPLTSTDFILQLRPLVAGLFSSLNLFHHSDRLQLHAWTHLNTHIQRTAQSCDNAHNWDLPLESNNYTFYIWTMPLFLRSSMSVFWNSYANRKCSR